MYSSHTGGGFSSISEVIGSDKNSLATIFHFSISCSKEVLINLKQSKTIVYTQIQMQIFREKAILKVLAKYKVYIRNRDEINKM